MVTSLKLEEICTTFKSDILVNKIEKNTGEYPVFGAKGIATNIQSYQQSKPYISIIKWGAGVGRAELRPAYSSIVATMLGVIPNENIDLQWLCYLLQSMHLEQYATNAVVPNLYFKDYCTKKVSVPDYLKQEEISHILGTVQQIIEYRKKQLETLDYLTKARFVEMFGDPADNVSANRVDLSEICRKITDGEHGSVARVANGHPYLNAKHIMKNGQIDWDTITFIGDDDHQRIYKRCNPEEGDILLTTTGTIGNVAIMPKYEEVSMDRGITLLKIDKQKATSEFVAELLKQPSIQMEMGANVHASAIGHLFMNKVKKLPAIVPSMKKQIEFTSFVKQVDKSKIEVQKALEKDQLLFESLMQKYFG